MLLTLFVIVLKKFLPRLIHIFCLLFFNKHFLPNLICTPLKLMKKSMMKSKNNKLPYQSDIEIIEKETDDKKLINSRGYSSEVELDKIYHSFLFISLVPSLAFFYQLRLSMSLFSFGC